MLTPSSLMNVVLKRNASRLVFTQFGVPGEVLRRETFPTPSDVSSRSEVLVKMLMSPIHPADINTIQGSYPNLPDLPAVGGGEGVGVVVAKGSQVTNLEEGDWVFPSKNGAGTWTSHLSGPEDDFIKVRNDIPVEAAATLRSNPGTAYRMLRDFVQLGDGDTIIQNGSNSAVGRALIQIARKMKLRSINVVRDREEIASLKNELKALGADHVWTEEELRKTQAFREKELERPKIAFNCVGGTSATELIKSLDHGGFHVTYGGMSLKPVTAATSALIFKGDGNTQVLGSL